MICNGAVLLAAFASQKGVLRARRRGLAWLVVLAGVLSSTAAVQADSTTSDGLSCRQSLGASRHGGAGLFDLPQANPGCPWQLRTALWLQGFVQYGHVLSDDRNQQLGGAVQIAATLGSHVETWVQIGTRSSRNQRPTTQDASDARPTLTLGRSALGIKLHSPVARFVHLALQPSLRVHSGPYDFGPNVASVDGGIDALVGFELDRLPRLRALPLRVSLRVGYLHDRSGEVVSALDCMAQGATACLATRLVYNSAYDINQPRVELGLGADLRFALAKDTWLEPFAVYALSLVTGPGDAVLRAQLMSQVASSVVAASEERVGQTLSLGVRALLPWLVTLDLGMQIALSSWGYIMGAKLPQIAGFGALSFAFDLVDTRAAPATASGNPRVPPSSTDPRVATGLVRGVVRDRATRAPLPGAIVRFVGVAQNALLANARGEFESGPLPAGTLELEASRSDHQTTRTTLLLRPAAEVFTEIELDASTRALPARLALSIRDESDQPIATATAALSRPGQRVPLDAGSGTAAVSAKVSAGVWRLRIDALGFLSREQVLAFSPGEDRALTLHLLSRSRTPRVALSPDEILLSDPLQFVADARGSLLSPASQRELAEVIDLLIHHPEILQLRIEAASGPGTDARLIAIREYLIQGGIAPERVLASELPADENDRPRPFRVQLRVGR